MSEEKKAELRWQVRPPLLTAFDIYSKNVAYGIEQETEKKHLEIIEWYKKVLDLEENALNNVPSEIRKYL